MRALMSETAGGAESLILRRDIPDPVPGPEDLLIEVAACGVNFPDLLLIRDLYQVRPPRPFAPGAEIAGTVLEIGTSVRDFKIGDRVIGRCGWGGMSEKIALDAQRCTLIPTSMPFHHAATFLFTYATAYYALVTRGRLQAAETVLVLGAAGGVGIAAVQIAKALGARPIAAVSSSEKLGFALDHGAVDGLVYPAALDDSAARALSEPLKYVLGPAGADVVLDPIGGAFTEIALRATAPGGRYLVLGFTAGIPSVPLNLPLLKSCDIIGVNWRTLVTTQPQINRRNERALFELYEQGKIAPVITGVFPLEDAAKAIAELKSRRAMGKMVVTMVR